MRKNIKPIFIHANARGGSNIIMNMLLSHPDVCLSNGETHKVFKGTKWDPLWRRWFKKAAFDLPIRLFARQDFFDPDDYRPRKKVPNYIKSYMDYIFYQGRFWANVDTHNRYREEGVEYTKEELAGCRLLTKSLDGLVFTGDAFNSMYPDAAFLGLVRNGLAVCEGFTRRGISAEHVGYMYRNTVCKMINSANIWENYHLYKYEAMVGEPQSFMRDIYQAANLDLGRVPKVRLQSKGVVQADGKRIHMRGKDRQVFWHDHADFHNYIKSDINANQIKQLYADNKRVFLSVAGDVMEELGYI